MPPKIPTKGAHGTSHPAKEPDLAIAAPLPATPAPAAAIEVAGSMARTAFEKRWSGAVRLNVPSTNATTSSCSSLRPRESRCRTASSVNSNSAATRSTDFSSR